MRVVIADDSGIFRQGLRLLLEAARTEVIADVEDLPALISALKKYGPDACIVDVRMPPTHTNEGIEAAAIIRKNFPRTGVLILSTYADTAWTQQLMANGLDGVGYLLKDRVENVAVITNALGRVAIGGTAIDPEIIDALMVRRRSTSRLDRLTRRERLVLVSMAQGLSNAGIARALSLSPKTIEAHVASIFTTLDLPPDPTGSENRRVRAVLRFLDTP